MKPKSAGFSQRYLLALREHLKRASDASLLVALRLGSEAVARGLDTKALAGIHERALTKLMPSNRKNGKVKGGEIFYALVTTPIKETPRPARGSEIIAKQAQASTSRHRLKETAVPQNGKVKSKSLKESLELQKRLRQLAHLVLAGQEDERKKISRELQEQIAQTLLGINVRLLSLKQMAKSNPNGLKNGIASTRRLVVQSAKSLRRFARELDFHWQT